MDGTGIIFSKFAKGIPSSPSFMASLGMCSSYTHTHIYIYIHNIHTFGDNLILCYHPGTCLTSQLPTASGRVTWNSWDGFGFGSSEQLLRWDTVVPELSERTMERRHGKVPGLIGILYISCCSNSLFGPKCRQEPCQPGTFLYISGNKLFFRGMFPPGWRRRISPGVPWNGGWIYPFVTGCVMSHSCAGPWQGREIPWGEVWWRYLMVWAMSESKSVGMFVLWFCPDPRIKRGNPPELGTCPFLDVSKRLESRVGRGTAHQSSHFVLGVLFWSIFDIHSGSCSRSP